MSDSELEERVAEAVSERRQMHRYGEVCTQWRSPAMDAGYIRDQLDLARAAIAEVQRWHPLETAEGDPVLLGFPRGMHALIGHMENGKWGWLDDEMGFHPFETQPVGWMFIPPAPQIT